MQTGGPASFFRRLIGWFRAHGPPAASAVTAGAATWFIAYFGVDPSSGQGAIIGLPKIIGPFWTDVIFIVLFTGVSGVFVYIVAKIYPTPTYTATVIGVVTTLIMRCVARQCDLSVHIPTGVMAAGASVAIFASGRVFLRTQRSAGAPSFSVISLLQISVAIYMFAMVLVGVLAMTSDLIDIKSIGQILAFAGIGLTAAASLESPSGPKNWLALAAISVGLVGAYIQMAQAIDMIDVAISATDILLVSSIVAFVPFIFLMFQSNRIGLVRVASVLTILLVVALGGIFGILIVTGCR